MPKNYTKPHKDRFVPDPTRFLYNVDTLYFSVDCMNYESVLGEGLMSVLDHGKEIAGNFNGEFVEIPIKLHAYKNDIMFVVQPTGKTSYSYQIRNEDFAIYFAKTRHENQFPVYVQINQFKLWQHGATRAYMESLEILNVLGFTVSSCKPSRIDLCCHSDQFQWVVTDLKKLEHPNRMDKPNFFKLNPLDMSFETVMYGKRNVNQLRIYNKTAELFAKNKFHFLQVYEEHGLDSDKVWNIEFEMHRKFLKGIEVNGQKDFFDDMDNLLSEQGLSILWTKMTSDKFIHNSPFWKQLQEGDPDKFSKTNDYMTRIKDIDDSLYTSTSAVIGYLKRFVLNKEENDLNSAIIAFLEQAHETHEDKIDTFEDSVLLKKSMFVTDDINKLIKKKPSK